jgi:hypothetical protein
VVMLAGLEGAEEEGLPVLSIWRFAAGGNHLEVPVTSRAGEAGEVAGRKFAAEIEPGGRAAGLAKFGAAVDVFERRVCDEVGAGGLCGDGCLSGGGV